MCTIPNKWHSSYEGTPHAPLTPLPILQLLRWNITMWPNMINDRAGSWCKNTTRSLLCNNFAYFMLYYYLALLLLIEYTLKIQLCLNLSDLYNQALKYTNLFAFYPFFLVPLIE